MTHPTTCDCLDCFLLAHSLYLKLVLTLRDEERQKLEELKARFAGPEGVVRAGGYAVRGTVG